MPLSVPIGGCCAPLVQLQELVEVPAGTEARSPACHGDDRGAGVGLSAGDLFVQGFDEGDVEGVAPLGAVEQQPPDGAALLDEQRFHAGQRGSGPASSVRRRLRSR
jgi:hypothetical protein